MFDCILKICKTCCQLLKRQRNKRLFCHCTGMNLSNDVKEMFLKVLNFRFGKGTDSSGCSKTKNVCMRVIGM